MEALAYKALRERLSDRVHEDPGRHLGPALGPRLHVPARLKRPQDLSQLPAHVHGAGPPALGRSYAPMREGAGHADLARWDVEVAQEEADPLPQAEPGSRQG